MKKILILFSLIAVSLIGISQLNVFKLSEVKRYPLNVSPSYKQWYEVDSNSFAMLFNQNTVGVIAAFDKIKEILEANDLDFKKPSIEKSFLASYVEGLNDYENLNLSCKTGGSIIKKIWKKGTQQITILLDEEYYTLLYSKNISE